MSELSLVIQLPQPLYQRLQRFTRLTRRTLESVVLQTLDANVPSLPENLPETLREIWLALEQLDDEALCGIARGTISQQHQEEYSLLLEKNRQGSLTASEQTMLDKLYFEANQYMLRKAYANVLLKWRGHQLPTLAELSCQ
ncbi:MAG TPA: hypothetical protein DCM38_14670 [Gammaproteobacteria bacterium]|nr:hypothetical protein [Candidatus Parabeggiatoa sp.]HAI70666.1 hypothetical protein [Gammaproteobacteria bacterium]